MKKIILASVSPRRSQILSMIGLNFAVEKSGFQEEDLKTVKNPHKLVKDLSWQKAKNVAEKHQGEDTLVIGADTLVRMGKTIFGKPKNPKEAKLMLKKLSGQRHSVTTGYTIVDTRTNKIVTNAVETKVFFRKLADEEIDAYLRTGEHKDKAGAYAIQGFGALLIQKIEGDFFNVVGLPLSDLAKSLKKFGVKIPG